MTPQAFKDWRAGHGWTQKVAAEKLGVSLDTVKSWEAGRAPISRLVELATRGVDASEG